jgi:hypothetical protein
MKGKNFLAVEKTFFKFYLFLFFAILGNEPRALQMLGNQACSSMGQKDCELVF